MGKSVCLPGHSVSCSAFEKAWIVQASQEIFFLLVASVPAEHTLRLKDNLNNDWGEKELMKHLWLMPSFLYISSFLWINLFFQSWNCILCLIVTLHFFILILRVSVFMMCKLNSELRNSHLRANRKSNRHYGSGKLATVRNKWKNTQLKRMPCFSEALWV